MMPRKSGFFFQTVFRYSGEIAMNFQRIKIVFKLIRAWNLIVDRDSTNWKMIFPDGVVFPEGVVPDRFHCT